MDTLSDVFHHLRSSGALVGRTLADPPWSTRFEEHASLTLVTPLRGSAWIREENASYPLRTRDIAIVVGPDPFDVSSDPELVISPLFIQTEDGICRDSQGSSIEDIALGIRTCGTQLGANDALLTGSFTVDGRIADRLLKSLPRVLVVPESARRTTSLDLLETEILRDEPGQQAILDRLLDLVLVQALRDWFALPTTEAPGWYRASSDPIVGPALAAMHSFPHRSWTVQRLAEESRVSRATLARRFTELLGSPPMSYLNGWRLCLAADLLERSDATVESIAHSVGYGSAFSFSTAFHREYGVRPSAYRA